MRIAKLMLSLLLAAAPMSSVAEMDENVILLAKERLTAHKSDTLRQSLTPLLEKRGVPIDDHAQIVADVGYEIASCIVDGLEADSSPISQAAILAISEVTDFADDENYFESAYSREEIGEYMNTYFRILAECNNVVYQRNYLITR